jgi:hypothetical protein
MMMVLLWWLLLLLPLSNQVDLAGKHLNPSRMFDANSHWIGGHQIFQYRKMLGNVDRGWHRRSSHWTNTDRTLQEKKTFSIFKK